MAKISARAARERLELIAPEASDALAEVLTSFRKRLKDTDLKDKDRVVLARELRMIAAQVLDRGGVPAVRQVQTESKTLMLTGSVRDIVGDIAKRLGRLEPEDRELLLTMAPQLKSVVPDG